MQMLFRLFGPRRRKNQEDIAARAAEVIVHVLFDVGLDRFLAGTILLDRQFRLRFYAMAPQPSPAILACIAVRELDEAQVFRAQVLEAGIDAPGSLPTPVSWPTASCGRCASARRPCARCRPRAASAAACCGKATGRARRLVKGRYASRAGRRGARVIRGKVTA